MICTLYLFAVQQRIGILPIAFVFLFSFALSTLCYELMELQPTHIGEVLGVSSLLMDSVFVLSFSLLRRENDTSWISALAHKYRHVPWFQALFIRPFGLGTKRKYKRTAR